MVSKTRWSVYRDDSVTQGFTYRRVVAISSSILRLTICDIKRLVQVHGEVLKHLRGLEDLSISLCDELRYLWESKSDEYKFLRSLQKLKVVGCNQLVSLEEKEANVGISMENIKEVILHDCEALESYNCPNSVEMLVINSCFSMTSLTFSTLLEHNICDNVRNFPVKEYDNIESFSNKDFGFPLNLRLRSLEICNFKNVKVFPHEHLHSLTSLEEMIIRDCPSMDYSFPCGVWPPNVRVLKIGCLKKPMSEWGLQNYPTLLVNLHPESLTSST